MSGPEIVCWGLVLGVSYCRPRSNPSRKNGVNSEENIRVDILPEGH